MLEHLDSRARPHVPSPGLYWQRDIYSSYIEYVLRRLYHNCFLGVIPHCMTQLGRNKKGSSFVIQNNCASTSDKTCRRGGQQKIYVVQFDVHGNWLCDQIVTHVITKWGGRPLIALRILLLYSYFTIIWLSDATFIIFPTRCLSTAIGHVQSPLAIANCL